MFPTMKFPDKFTPNDKIEAALDGDFTSLISDYNSLSATGYPTLTTHTVAGRGADNPETRANNAMTVYNIHHLRPVYGELMEDHGNELTYASWYSLLHMADWGYVCMALKVMPYEMLSQFLSNERDVSRFYETSPIKEVAKILKKSRKETFFQMHTKQELRELLTDMSTQ